MKCSSSAGKPNPRCGLENGYCYIRETDEHMYKMDAPVLEDLLNTDPERAAHMRQYAQDFYNASKYLLYNNKKFD